MPVQNFVGLAKLKALGVCPCMFIGLAELKALGVCPCNTASVWQNWRHWACAHAEFCWFGRTEGTRRVRMQHVIGLEELGALGVPM